MIAASVSVASEPKEPPNRGAAAEGAVAGTSVTVGAEVVAGDSVASEAVAGAIVGFGDGDGLTATCRAPRT